MEQIYISLSDANAASAKQDYQFDGSNHIDVFPNIVVDSSNPSNPSIGDITIQGVTYRTELWDIGDEKTYKWEINHEYFNGKALEPHCRIFPVDDNAGTVSYQYEYFVLHVGGTTSPGGTISGVATVAAGDKTANIGKYISIPLMDSAALIGGDMLIGVFSRIAGTYASDVSISEIGMHMPIGKLGDTLI